MDHFNIREASKIFHVESYNLRSAVGSHHGHKPCVMNLNPHDTVCYQERFPSCVGCWGFAKDLKKSFDLCEFVLRFLNTISKAVFRNRAGRGVPKLGDILKRPEALVIADRKASCRERV